MGVMKDIFQEVEQPEDGFIDVLLEEEEEEQAKEEKSILQVNDINEFDFWAIHNNYSGTAMDKSGNRRDYHEGQPIKRNDPSSLLDTKSLSR